LDDSVGIKDGGFGCIDGEKGICEDIDGEDSGVEIGMEEMMWRERSEEGEGGGGGGGIVKIST
jgi:hypothetical protein